MGRLDDTIEALKQKFFGAPKPENFLPNEGYKFVPGANMQAPVGSPLLGGGIPSPSPTPTPQQQYRHNIQVPSDDGRFKINPDIAQYLMESFDDIGQATNSATLLHHPTGETIGSKYYGQNQNRGENPGLVTGKGWNDYNYKTDGTLKYVKNLNGEMEPSEDRGLFRINNATFYGLQADARKNKKLKKLGINSYEDMYDPKKNAQVARMIYDEGDWWRWFAAPIGLVEGNDSLAQR